MPISPAKLTLLNLKLEQSNLIDDEYPSSATSVIEQLIEFQTVKRPYIGITASAVDSNIAKRYHLPEGIYVESVEEGSSAEKAGLQVSDIITKTGCENWGNKNANIS